MAIMSFFVNLPIFNAIKHTNNIRHSIYEQNCVFDLLSRKLLGQVIVPYNNRMVYPLQVKSDFIH